MAARRKAPAPLNEHVERRFAPTDAVLSAIQAVVAAHPAWGVRKVWATLRRDRGLRVGHKRVHSLMREAGLVYVAEGGRSSWPPGRVTVDKPNRRWATDLTTVYTRRNGWVGVTVTVDCECRSALGLVVSLAQDATTVLGSLREALVAEFGTPARAGRGLEWRTDRGPQFTGAEARALRDAWRIRHTFVPPGRPTGNAVVERLVRTLKEEVV